MREKPLAKGELFLIVIDGLPAMRVKQVAPPVSFVPNGCKNDNHCAAHCSGPFYCCKCGAGFEIVGDGT